MTAAFAFLLLAIVPQQECDPVKESVDLIEVNHFYDTGGRHIFDQVIFWDWSDEHGRDVVRAWRLLKTPEQWPQFDPASGRWVAVWCDHGQLRRVAAISSEETWTQFDPEAVNREFLPPQHRRELLLLRETTPAMPVPARQPRP